MTTTTRRSRRDIVVSLASISVVVVLALVVAWLVMAIWIKGGPQPVHRIVIAIPAPQLPAAARRRA